MSIRWIENALNAYLQKLLKTNDDYVIAVDTDSVVGSTLIKVNGEYITIEDFYEEQPADFIRNDTVNNNYVKKVSNCVTDSVSATCDLESKPISYVMKHKVKKKLYKITSSDGNEVTVTEDHSIIVLDKKTNKIMSITPKQLSVKNHYIITVVEQE